MKEDFIEKGERKERKNSKNLILLKAFKLFAEKTYEQVTFSELEASTDLTRGAIMYHFKTKELIFKSMCDKFLLKDSSILEKLNRYVTPETTLKEFIDLYVRVIREMKSEGFNLGVKNLNKALVNITNQATFYYPSFEMKALKWQIIQIQLWKNILQKAVNNKEIRKDIDISVASELFEDTYCGISYAGIAYPDGIDFDRLHKAFNFIYNSIKN